MQVWTTLVVVQVNLFASVYDVFFCACHLSLVSYIYQTDLCRGSVWVSYSKLSSYIQQYLALGLLWLETTKSNSSFTAQLPSLAHFKWLLYIRTYTDGLFRHMGTLQHPLLPLQVGSMSHYSMLCNYNTYMAVPKCSSTELLLRAGSYALCKCGKYSWVYPAHTYEPHP